MLFLNEPFIENRVSGSEKWRGEEISREDNSHTATLCGKASERIGHLRPDSEGGV